MPIMPDPISTCPIFGRFYEFSKDEDQVKNALAELQAGTPWIKVAVTFDIVLTDSCWEIPPGGPKYDEQQYLEDFWLGNNGWWSTHADFDKWKVKLTKAITKALIYAKNEGLCIYGYWECVGKKLDAEAWIQKSPLKNQVMLHFVTPPPGADAKQVPC